MALVDVSAPLSDEVRSYIPGVTYTRTRPIFTLEADGVESHEVVLSTLSGTYFETGRHVRHDAISVDEVPSRPSSVRLCYLTWAKRGRRNPSQWTIWNRMPQPSGRGTRF